MSTHRVNSLFVTTDMELSSTSFTDQPSGPIHPPVPPVLTPTLSPHPGLGPGERPGLGPGAGSPDLYGSGFVQQDDPATSHSLESLPGGLEGKA